LKSYSFVKPKKNLREVMVDRNLASLGDAYINFIYSLALSNKHGKPVGTKVKGSVLADALRKAGLRQYLPSRVDQHSLADAVEALLVYAWLTKHITLAETVEQLLATDSLEEDLCQLLSLVMRRIKFSS
jgi:hypothetical protein